MPAQGGHDRGNGHNRGKHGVAGQAVSLGAGMTEGK